MYLIKISIEKSGQRIDNFLFTFLKGVPKSLIYHIIRNGKVRINKNKVEPKYKLQYNDELYVPPIHKSNNKQLIIDANLSKVKALNNAVLYEDDCVLIINKPSGIAVHGGSGLRFGAVEALRSLRPDIHFLELVHRLDRDTSGALLLAKKRSALKVLHHQLRNRSVKKNYLALVRGRWYFHTKIVSAPLLKRMYSTGKQVVQINDKGKPSETHFQTKENFTLATLVKANPITGRTHQIRVHAKYAGYPIAFDNRYGDSVFNCQLKNCGLNRLFLHATELCFYHPVSNRKIKIEAPLDTTLVRCLSYMRTYYSC